MALDMRRVEARLGELYARHHGDGVNAVAAAFRDYFTGEVFPSAVNAAMQRGLDSLTAARLAARAAKPGDRVPDFELPAAAGGSVRLSDRLAAGPVVLVFYRGGWCPYCNLHLNMLQRLLSEFRAAGATLVAVSPQDPDHSLTTAETNGLGFEVLSDPANQVARALGLVFPFSDELRTTYLGNGVDLPAFSGSARWELPMPGTFVIAPDGMVAAAWVDEDYRTRAEPAAVLAAVRRLPALGATP
ncbi:MAG: AhpC/TSA family protein [Gemmataceae bacterium]|nr:AhpC/TSA family protein [Gemmataceae bacterium]